jgi:threonine dehydrogenase-like Zn-dependent dehydrogenase
VDWAPFIEKASNIRISNPGSHPDFPSVWRKAVALMQAGYVDQTKLISHTWSAERGAEAMQASAHPNADYIKGYLSWD